MSEDSGLGDHAGMTSKRDFLQAGSWIALAAITSLARFPARAADAPWRLKPVFVPGLSSPEDMNLIPDTPWVITSSWHAQAKPGSAPAKEVRTFFVNTETRASRPAFPDNCVFDLDKVRFGDIEPPKNINFHGLDVTRGPDGKIILYQVNHKGSDAEGGGRESIEVFEIEMTAAGPSLRWRGAIPLPSWVGANDCCALPEGGVAVTNSSFGGMEDFPAMMAGRISGNVIEWHNSTEGWDVVEGTDLNGPNGIAVSPSGEYYFICSSAANALHRVSRKAPHSDRSTLDLGAMPDNATWTPDGHLLIATTTGTMTDIAKATVAGKARSSCRVADVI